jgi:hypothetical protein
VASLEPKVPPAPPPARKRRLTPEEREQRATAKAARAELRERKRRGEDMPALPEALALWRELVAEKRRDVLAADVIISSRGVSAARGLVGRLLRQVAPGRPLQDGDEARVVDRCRSMFAAALATERPGYTVGLETVCSAPDKYQGKPAEQRPTVPRQPANKLSPHQARWGKGTL